MLNKNMTAFFFSCNNSTSFEFCKKTVKSRLFKKYLKRRKSRAQFFLSFGWLHFSEKIIENCNSVGAHKVGKIVSFWPNFDPYIHDIRRAKKGKLFIPKKGSTVKEIYKEIYTYITALTCFSHIFYFAQKRTLRP